MRKQEIDQITEILLSNESLLVLGEPGAGKTTVGEKVRSNLEHKGYSVAMVKYSGSAKDLLEELCDQLGVDTKYSDGNKFKNKTALMLKDDIRDKLANGSSLLIVDDAQRWSTSLRYWLEDLWRAKIPLLLLACQPPAKEIFTKLPIIELKPIADTDIREVMRLEADTQGLKLSLSELASLQSRSGNNPEIAKRIIREAALGLSDDKSGNHYQYIDGTPFLLTLISFVGMIRFAGLGLGDKSLYIMGGILTILAVGLRSLLYAANRGNRKL